MTIKDLKDLEKVMRLCRKQGVLAIEIDGVKFQLNPETAPQPRQKAQATAQIPAITPGGISEDTLIPTDFPTTEELLMWSAGSDQQ